MERTEIKNPKELKQICNTLTKNIKPPHVVLLEGPLAVGKSLMVSYMASQMGFPEQEIHSPSFSLINVYKKSPHDILYHVDLFRLKTIEEVENIAFWDIFCEPAIVFIEWPQLVQKHIPPLWNQLKILLSFAPQKESRILEWTFIPPISLKSKGRRAN